VNCNQISGIGINSDGTSIWSDLPVCWQLVGITRKYLTTNPIMNQGGRTFISSRRGNTLAFTRLFKSNK